MTTTALMERIQPLIDSGFISTHRGVLLWNAIQLLNVVAGIQLKAERDSPMPYSKFALKSASDGKVQMVPSRLGMFIFYAPALIVALVFIYILPELGPERYQVTLATWMCMWHFAKRTLEVLFLHKYSGSIEMEAVTTIGSYYAFVTFMICGTASANTGEFVSQLGQALFYVGMAGNFYHHYLLASLRSDTTIQKYVPPRGGLFEYVAAPHYLFELIGWLGIAVASESLTGYLSLGGMIGYLWSRSANQNNWNRSKFDKSEWPLSRKNLIPFIY